MVKHYKYTIEKNNSSHFLLDHLNVFVNNLQLATRAWSPDTGLLNWWIPHENLLNILTLSLKFY